MTNILLPINEKIKRWELRFLHIAFVKSGWSKDPSTKVGAVISDINNREISSGYNGFPMGVDDSPEMYENRHIKLKRIIHAEKNAILFAKRDITGCNLHVTLPPCAQCASMIIQSGIAKVVTIQPTPDQIKRWGDDMEEAKEMMYGRVHCVEYTEKELIDYIISTIR